ncbi:MAG: transposase [Pseudomonadota bacterium]
MDHRGPLPTRPAQNLPPDIGDEKKTPKGLLENFEECFAEARDSFGQERVFKRARLDALSALAGLGRHTLTGLIAASGRQFQDWSADYRLFSEERFDQDRLFGAVRRQVEEFLAPGEAVVAAMDDTLIRKRGRKIPGVAYRRDPLGPPFHVNFITAQRYVQMSIALPAGTAPSNARMIPVDFQHAPTPKRPGRKATEKDLVEYKTACKQMNICKKGVERIHVLRNALDSNRPLRVVADNRFTNATVLKNLPPDTAFIGRIRKDSKLYFPPGDEDRRGKGRRLVYGTQAPTPEEIRKDESIPWETCTVWATGREHDFKVKTLAPIRSRMMGPHDLRLVVIAPLAYRPCKTHRILYRQPAYLLCTDPALTLQELIQSYVWRWDIEVNFRDEKQIIGVGEAQVRNEVSVRLLPAFLVAVYAMLLVSGAKTYGSNSLVTGLPLPVWRRNSKKQRASTEDFRRQLRCELWGAGMGLIDFSGFSSHTLACTNPEKFLPDLPSAVLYAVA